MIEGHLLYQIYLVAYDDIPRFGYMIAHSNFVYNLVLVAMNFLKKIQENYQKNMVACLVFNVYSFNFTCMQNLIYNSYYLCIFLHYQDSPSVAITLASNYWCKPTRI